MHLPTGNPEKVNMQIIFFKRAQIENYDEREREGTSGQDISRISKNRWCSFKAQTYQYPSSLGLVRLWPQTWKWRVGLNKHMS